MTRYKTKCYTCNDDRNTFIVYKNNKKGNTKEKGGDKKMKKKNLKNQRHYTSRSSCNHSRTFNISRNNDYVYNGR